MRTYSGGGYSPNRNYYKKPFRKTKGFYFLLIILIAGAAFVYSSIKKSENTTGQNQKFTDQVEIPITSAKVSFASGKLETRPADSSVWQEIGQDYQVQTNDLVKTGPSTKAILELPDKSVVRMAENAEIKISQMGMADIVIEQLNGQVFHRVNGESTAIYRVKNGSTELTALGTGFNVLVSGQLTYLTVTESKVKVKIYNNNEDIVNMRTAEAGSKATINPTIELNQMIKVEDVATGSLLAQDWYGWNLEKDREQKFGLGIFEQSTKLVITEPKEEKTATDSDKITIKGETDPGAEIFMSGKELENSNGQFTTEYLLSSGENKIEIVVKKGKNTNQKTITVESTKKKEQIILTGQLTAKNQVELKWETKNIADFKEYKVLGGGAGSPTYLDSPHHTVGKTASSDTWQNLSDGKYFFRVCVFTSDDKCLTYSNDVEITIGNGAITEGSINLTAKVKADSVALNWTLSKELNSSEGFKTIISQVENPVFPGNSYHSLSSNERNDTWKKLSPGQYFLRVCLLKNNACAKYSNNAKIAVTETSGGSITLSGAAGDGAINLYWEVDGTPITKGFKAIIAKEPGVEFPGAGHHLLTSSSATSDTWTGLESGKIYYFRVCQNLGSSCGVYSNEVSFTFK